MLFYVIDEYRRSLVFLLISGNQIISYQEVSVIFFAFDQ